MRKKICTKCHQKKKLTEFYKDLTKKDRHRPDCEICNLRQLKKYRQTEHGKAVLKLSLNNYNHSERGKAAQKRYSQTKKGKATQKASHKRTRIRYPKRWKAKNAVSYAIATGRLLPASSKQCYYCPNKAHQHHHYKGYERKNWLKVRPTCRKCHRKIHKIGA